MHIAMMLDLETFGLEESSLVLSAGIAIGDLNSKDERTPMLERECFITAASQKGRTVNVSTIDWWMEQIRQGVPLPNSNDKIALSTLLDAIDDLFANNRVATVWSKGADFDIKIIEHVYKQHSRKAPWHYRQVRCFRTVEGLFQDVVAQETAKRLPSELAHGALGDARYQYRMLHHYWDHVTA